MQLAADTEYNFCRTYSGKKLWLLNPDPSDITIIDIAHGLANTCRYGGQIRHFYSVAEHCIHLVESLPEDATREKKLATLLHDASEAYLPDVVGPIKQCELLAGYRRIEENLMGVIALVFGLSPDSFLFMKTMDRRIQIDEMLAGFDISWKAADDPLGVEIRFWSPEKAECRFLSLYQQIVADTELEQIYLDQLRSYK